ncbi:MAG: ferrous iron transport protein B [Burkholderiaceae bacterium]
MNSSSCTTAALEPGAARLPRSGARVALVGMPNTGKSTLFNRLSGVSARTGNWPGMTVELETAKILLGARMVELVDLPGLYSMLGTGEDEQVTRRFLEQEPVSALLVVISAPEIERQLPLLLQLRSLGRPLIVALNMADEAKRLGLRIDTDALAAELGCQVLLVSARNATGVRELKAAMLSAVEGSSPQVAEPATAAPIDSAAFVAEVGRLAERALDAPHVLPARLTDKLDAAVLHPVFGMPLFFLSMWLLFQAVYGIGVPLQDGLSAVIDWAKASWIAPAVASWPAPAQSFVIDGLIEGVGTVLTFLPIILIFFILMAVVEDSGYMVRVAVLMDRFMSRLGLDGRAFVMQLMGLGCNVPALLGTRVMRSRQQRLLAMLIIPFSLCSARLQVLVFITAVFFSPVAAPWVMMALYLVSFLVAFGTAALWKRRFTDAEPLLLEFPPYRVPTLRALAHQAWQSTASFLSGAAGFVLLGVLLVWLLTHVPFDAVPASPATLAGRLADFVSPVLAPIGIDASLSVALIFGVVAKEIVLGGLAVIFATGQDDLGAALGSTLTWAQAASFMLFILIYTPCVASLAAIRRESKSIAFTALATVWPLVLAWGLCFVFYQVARHFV